MKEKDTQLFKQLVEAYYKDCFEATLEKLIAENFETKEEAKQVLATLSGVEVEVVEDDHTFAQNLVDAITQKQVRQKIIQKVRSCQSDCQSVDGKSTCQSVCPFDAILKDNKSGEKWIDEVNCMNCGRCVSACEKGNYLETPQFLPLAELLKDKQEVVAIVAPAIAGQFGESVTLDQLREAFIKIGFTDMVEVALAADVLSLKEAIEFNDYVKKDGDFMISSCCCPIWVAMLRKVYHELIDHVSPSVSPMIAMGRMLKTLKPNIKVVFIGPCMAKKSEAKEKDLVGIIDYVLTFQELQVIFEVLKIEPNKLQGVPSIDYASRGGRLYARTGGVSQAIWEVVDQMFPDKRELFTATQADGMKACKELLENLKNGTVKATFVEGMGCQGGCVGGPKAIIDKELGKEAVDKVAYESAVKIPIHSKVLLDLFAKMGIENLDELKEHYAMFERKF